MLTAPPFGLVSPTAADVHSKKHRAPQCARCFFVRSRLGNENPQRPQTGENRRIMTARSI